MGRHAVAPARPRARGPYARGVEILLWLVPSVVVTVAAMAWVSWVGRDGRGEVDRDVAVERLGRALAKDLPAGTRRTPASGARPQHRHRRTAQPRVRAGAGHHPSRVLVPPRLLAAAQLPPFERVTP